MVGTTGCRGSDRREDAGPDNRANPQRLAQVDDILVGAGEGGQGLVLEGLGLGLAYCKKIVESMRGTISHSAKGKGTVFTVRVPLEEGP